MLGGMVGDIVGEEDESAIDISAPPFRAGEITAPAQLEALITSTREKIDTLATSLPKRDETV